MPYVPSIQQTAALLGEPAPNWRWVVALPNLTPGVPTPNKPVTLSGLTPTTIAPFGLVNRITFGTRTIDTTQRYAGGRQRNYPRWISTPNATITFYENSNYIMTTYLRSWSNLVMDDNNNFGLPSSYKFPIVLYAFDVVNNSLPSMVGTLTGCWPPTVGGYEYAYDSSGPITLSTDFAVDEDVMSVGGANANFNTGSGGDGSSMSINDFAQMTQQMGIA